MSWADIFKWFSPVNALFSMILGVTVLIVAMVHNAKLDRETETRNREGWKDTLDRHRAELELTRNQIRRLEENQSILDREMVQVRKENEMLRELNTDLQRERAELRREVSELTAMVRIREMADKQVEARRNT